MPCIKQLSEEDAGQYRSLSNTKSMTMTKTKTLDSGRLTVQVILVYMHPCTLELSLYILSYVAGVLGASAMNVSPNYDFLCLKKTWTFLHGRSYQLTPDHSITTSWALYAFLILVPFRCSAVYASNQQIQATVDISIFSES